MMGDVPALASTTVLPVLECSAGLALETRTGMQRVSRSREKRRTIEKNDPRAPRAIDGSALQKSLPLQCSAVCSGCVVYKEWVCVSVLVVSVHNINTSILHPSSESSHRRRLY